MRVFENIEIAESEIRRDLAKGPEVRSTRVQQQTGIEITGRERLGYQYSILKMIDNVDELVEFGKERFPFYRDHAHSIIRWLEDEMDRRLDPMGYYRTCDPTNEPDCSEVIHPLLRTTLEGNYPSYTYQARLAGAKDHLVRALRKNPDSRRAYWPIFTPEDAQRIGEPTRVPCSIAYQPIIRDLGDGEERVVLFYTERSCDFDHFWLTDVFLATQFQRLICEDLGIHQGALIHYITSFHSFEVATQEIY